MIKALRILFYGDSNVWGYRPEGGRIAASDRFPAVAGSLIPEAEILENGANGRSSAFEHPVLPADLLGGATFAGIFREALPVDALVIMLGTNDVLPLLGLTPSETAANLARIMRNAREIRPGIPILLVSPPAPSPAAIDWEVGMHGGNRDVLGACQAEALAAAAQKEGAAFLDARESVPVFGAGDGFHLTVEEHKKLGLAVGSALRKLLEINARGAC